MSIERDIFDGWLSFLITNARIMVVSWPPVTGEISRATCLNITSGAPVMITAGHDDCHIKMYNELFFLLYISASLAKSKSLPAFIDSHQQLLSEHLIRGILWKIDLIKTCGEW